MMSSERLLNRVFFLVVALSLMCAGSARGAEPAAENMKQSIDTFFAAMKSDFDKSVSSPVLIKRNTKAINGYFLKLLKRHQPFYSLIRTDTRGKTVNEYTRVEGPAKEKRDIADQPWYKTVSTKHASYAGFLKEDNGRYYMLWASPLLLKAKGGKELFLGVVAAKIDIWDCFQKFSKTTKTPFLVRIDRKSLYDHTWKETIAYGEEPLAVWGVEKLTVRFPRAAAASAAAPAVDTITLQKARMDSVKAAQDAAAAAQAAQSLKAKKVRGIIIVIGFVAALLLIIVIYKATMAIRQRVLMNRINKEQIRR
jgi:hypothetical protein